MCVCIACATRCSILLRSRSLAHIIGAHRALALRSLARSSARHDCATIFIGTCNAKCLFSRAARALELALRMNGASVVRLRWVRVFAKYISHRVMRARSRVILNPLLIDTLTRVCEMTRYIRATNAALSFVGGSPRCPLFKWSLQHRRCYVLCVDISHR